MKTKTKKFISLEEALKAGNDGQNQEIKGRLIDREVFCNVGPMVEKLLYTADSIDEPLFTWDDVSNVYSYPEYRGEYADFDGGSEDQRTEEIERLRDLQSDLYDHITDENEDEIEAKRSKIEDEISELGNLETEPAEIYEWWAVSGWFAEKLESYGQSIVDAGSVKVWGRRTTGQAILLDYVITCIAADMGILEGQENSWAKKSK